MKLTSIQRKLSLFGLLLGLLCFFSPTLQAQNDAKASKQMTITLTTVDKDGNKSVKEIILTDDEVDESHVQQIVEDNLSGDEASVEVDVEITMTSDSKSDGEEMEITIDLDNENTNGQNVEINENVRTIIIEDGALPENIEINKDMKITVDGDKVYLNGEEIKDGDQDGQIRILQLDPSDIENINVEKFEDHKEIRIITKTIESNESFGAKKNKPGFLGVFYEDHLINEGENQENAGVYIKEVIDNTAAQKVGLKKGDIIKKVNGNTVNTARTFVKNIEAHNCCEEISLTYVRDGISNDIVVTLGDRRPIRQMKLDHSAFKEAERFDWKDLEGKEWQPEWKQMTKEEYKEMKSKMKCDPSNCTPEQRAKCCPETLSKEDQFMMGLAKSNCDPSTCDPKSCPPWMCDEKAQMGVYIEETQDGNGVLLTDVSEGKGSQRAGLQADDVIYKIDKTKVNSTDELIETIATYKPADIVTVKYLRDGKKQKTQVTLGSKQVRKEAYQNKRGNCCAPGTKTTIDKQTIIIKRKKNDDEVVIENPSFNIPNNSLEFSKLDLFPNPTNGELNIQFSTEEKAATSVRVLDVTGKEIYTDVLPNYNGNYSKKIDLTDQAGGVYFLRIQQGDKVYTEQIVITKAK